MPLPPPDPVKLVAALLWTDAAALAEASRRAEALWGPIDYTSPDHAFDATGYYEREMGSGLKRRILSFARLVPPEALPVVKVAAMGVEDSLRGPSGRRVNMDVGYMDVHKVVLASAKAGGPKLAIGLGVWADLACRYSKGRFHPFEWTFDDFRDGRYERDLLAIRERYKADLRRDTDGGGRE